MPTLSSGAIEDLSSTQLQPHTPNDSGLENDETTRNFISSGNGIRTPDPLHTMQTVKPIYQVL